MASISIERPVRATALLLALALLCSLGSPAPAGPKGLPRFADPIQLTPDTFGGYEPSIVVDRFNNVYVTAHKLDYALGLSPDPSGAAPLRSRSWLWWSSDGKTFRDMPGISQIGVDRFQVGIEGDLSVDQKGHIYFVDTNGIDSTFSRWKATGNGKVELDTTRPLTFSSQFIDDRPWVSSHGTGTVMYLANAVQSATTLPQASGGAYGPGRYTVYMSHDAGDTFDNIGKTLLDSGWCRPAADPRRGSKQLYVVCTDDKGRLWSFVSDDDGRSWSRHEIGRYNENDSRQTWPSVAVGRRGIVYALYNDTRGSGQFERSSLMLYTSRDRGRTWKAADVTPTPGLIHYSWLAVAPNGKLGIAYYHHDPKRGWYLHAGTASPGERFRVVSVTPDAPVATAESYRPPGDFFQIAFGPDNKLNLAWARYLDISGGDSGQGYGLNMQIYFSRQL